MTRIFYYILSPFLYLVSLLPFRILYLLSDFFYFFVYKVFSYRVQVVRNNLEKSFPTKTVEERSLIEKRFFKHLCDLFLETLKLLTISKNKLKNHVQIEDMSVFQHFAQKNQSIIVVMGHQGNWELAGCRFALDSQNQLAHQLCVLYHPLKNKEINQLVYRMRTRFGTRLYAMKDAFREILASKDKLTATVFIADQTPPAKNAFWTKFLNQETPVFKGTAKIAQKMNYPIVYVSVSRPKRGVYTINSELLVEKPSLVSEDEISVLHTKRLEQDIVKEPEIWLWSHRRWKHKSPK